MSPGDKLSLKGKLFELQKKLNIIDIENKRKDEFSFKPAILSYDLPEREGNVLECIKKAEIIRKQRKELLRASVQSHSEEGCTFSPKFVSKPTKNVLSEKRPVHERLTEKGKEYNANIIKKRVDIKKHDFDGKPLFVPTFMNKDRRPGSAWSNGTGKGTGNGPPNPDDFLLPEHGSYDNHHYQQHNYSRDMSPPPPPPSSHHSPKQHQPSHNHQQQQQFHSSQYSTPMSNTTQNFTPQSRLHIDSGVNQSGNNLSNFVGGNVTSGLYLNNVSADEFLYQDAKDREERFRLRATEAQEEVLQIANKSKVNSTSYLVLKKKAEREVNTVLKFLDPNVTGEIGYDAIRRGSQLLLSRRKILSADQVESITLQVFNVFDFEKVGTIRFAHFSTIALPLLFHQMMNAALQDIRQNTALGVASSQNSAVSAAESVEGGGVRFTATMDELQTVKNWLSQLVPIITSLEGRDTKPKADKQPEAVSFAPKINNYSLKLAARKEQKEKQQLAEIMNNHPNQLNSHLNIQRNNDSSMLDDGDNSTHFDGNSILDTTFDPQLTAQSRLSSADTAMVANREQANTAGTSLSASFQETLEVRNKLALIKKKQLVEQVTAAKLADCTFQPNIPHKRHLQRVTSRNNNTAGDDNNNSNNISNNNILSGGENEAKLTSSEGDSAKQTTTIYDRLYLQKRDFKATSSSDVSSYIIDELKYCTFQPQLATHNTPNTSAASNKSVKDIEGFEKSVRIRTVQEERQKAKELEETAHIREDEKYQKSRMLAKQGAVPFKSNLQERRVQQLQEAQQHRGQKTPRLYIDVKLSATKTAKIPICDFDVPYENALKFSKIYSLDANMTQILTTVIEQSMQKNNVPITVTHALEDLSTLQQDEDEELPSSEEESSGSEEENDEEDEDGTLHTSLTNEDNVESESVDDSSERSNALTPAAAVQYAQSMGIGVHNSRQLGSRSMDRSEEDGRGSSDNSVASSELDEEDEESRTASPYSRRLSPGGPAYGNR